MENLPTEYLAQLFIQTPLSSLLQLYQCDHKLTDLCNIDYLWQQRTLLEYNMKEVPHNLTWKEFYLKLVESTHEVKIFVNSNYQSQIKVHYLSTLNTTINPKFENGNIVILLDANNYPQIILTQNNDKSIHDYLDLSLNKIITITPDNGDYYVAAMELSNILPNINIMIKNQSPLVNKSTLIETKEKVLKKFKKAIDNMISH